jgi:DNA-binding transcriptional LysR family regulator
MQEIDLLKVDFNLLVALRALLKERNVTRAGERIGLSQSATSHALSRLRKVFDDPLLVRSGQDMLLTSRASALLEPLQTILLNIEQLIQPLTFDPKTAEGTIHIASSDYATCVILPSVIKQIEQEAPHLDLVCQNWNPNSFDLLRNGTIDLGFVALSVLTDKEFHHQELFNEEMVCVVRANHPVIGEVSIPQTGKSYVDTVLEELGMERRIMLKVAHFFAAPLIVAQSNLILITPSRVAKIFAQFVNLEILASPVKVKQYSYAQIWHPLNQDNLRHIWLRNLIATQTEAI